LEDADRFLNTNVLPELARLGYPEHDRIAIRLACGEAIVNAICHGNRQDPDKATDVRYRIGEDFWIRIEDQGNGFDPDAVPDPTLPEHLRLPRGRGLLLMRHYMDTVRYERGGRVCVMSRRKRPAESTPQSAR
jgi:serine/threonine-protein kinase RsbW